MIPSTKPAPFAVSNAPTIEGEYTAWMNGCEDNGWFYKAKVRLRHVRNVCKLYNLHPLRCENQVTFLTRHTLKQKSKAGDSNSKSPLFRDAKLLSRVHVLTG
jgi:hypothetical protein